MTLCDIKKAHQNDIFKFFFIKRIYRKLYGDRAFLAASMASCGNSRGSRDSIVSENSLLGSPYAVELYWNLEMAGSISSS